MHLFITENLTLSGENISTDERRIVYQCSRVLRMNTDSILQLQNTTTRYTLALTKLNDNILTGKILNTEELITSSIKKIVYIALPNRWDKLELITQKLTEIGSDSIVLWPAQRSILRKENKKKGERLQKIALEASEQAFRHSLPEIVFLEKLDESTILGESQILFAHQDGEELRDISLEAKKNRACIIGPEGGFTQEEIEFFEHIGQKTNFGTTTLRMETAAIIGARTIQNYQSL